MKRKRYRIEEGARRSKKNTLKPIKVKKRKGKRKEKRKPTLTGSNEVCE